jgi:hypothetical protein
MSIGKNQFILLSDVCCVETRLKVHVIQYIIHLFTIYLNIRTYKWC